MSRRLWLLAGKRALSMIEVLVVIVIIAILIAILWPYFGGDRTNAQDAKAQHNLQIAFADLSANQALNDSGSGFPSAASLVSSLVASEPQFTARVGASCSDAAGFSDTTMTIVSSASNPAGVTICTQSDSGTIFEMEIGINLHETISKLTSLTGSPINVGSPTIQGGGSIGNIETAEPGAWQSDTNPTFTYQWQDCDVNGQNCTNIVGATSSTYTLTSNDVGDTVDVIVTATNSHGSTPATSPVTSQIGGATPSDTTVPTISGTVTDGQTLTGSPGSWSGETPISYSYQWQDSTDGGTTWNAISGATNSTYVIPYGTYTGDELRIYVTANNDLGTGTAYSAATAAIQAAAPAHTANPVISGTPQDGQTLTTTNGTWTGTPTITYTYQWQYSTNGGTSYSNVAGATSSSWTIPYGGYVGDVFRVQVKGTNSKGNATASSSKTGTDAAVAPSNTVLPTVSGTIQDGSTLSSTNGTWVGSPTITYTYQWQYSSDGGLTYSNIPGATSSTYLIPNGTYDGDYLRIGVTATNGGGAATAYSYSTVQAVTETAPVNTAPPVITGTAQAGQQLSTSNGTWTGTINSYSYQWQYSTNGGSSWSNITGATSSTYTLDTTYLGDVIRAEVTAINADAQTTAVSSQTATVISSIPVGTVIPYAGTSSLPSGWALANGACTFSASAYPDLWNAIGSTYGGSAGAFCVPDMRGRLALGVAASGTGSTLGGSGGAVGQTGTFNPWGSPITENYSWSETPPAPAAVPHTHGVEGGYESNNYWPSWTDWNMDPSVNNNCCDEQPGIFAYITSTNESWTANTTTGITASGSATPSASYTVSNPPVVVTRYIIETQTTASPPCGALVGYASGGSLPYGAGYADGTTSSSCLDSAFSGVLPNLKGAFPIGQAASGTFSTLNTATGALNQQVTSTLTTSTTKASVSGSGWTDSITEGSHTGSFSAPTSTSGAGGVQGEPDNEAANNTAPTISANSNAGSIYTSSNYNPGSINSTASGAQSPSSGTWNTAFETVNWIGYTSAGFTLSTGEIMPYAGSSAPSGFLLANGTCYSTTGSYANLFAAIGYTYGGSGGSFCVPDMRGRFAMGVASSGTGSTLGANGGTLAPAPSLTFTGWTPKITIPSHSPSWTVPAHTHTLQFTPQSALGNAGGYVGEVAIGTSGGTQYTYTSDPGGGGTESSTVSSYQVTATAAVSGVTGYPTVIPPAYMALNYIIKY